MKPKIKPKYITKDWMADHGDCGEGWAIVQRERPGVEKVHIRDVVEWLKENGTREQAEWLYEKWAGGFTRLNMVGHEKMCSDWLLDIAVRYSPKAEYHLNCSQCPNTFMSEDGFPKPQICPDCEALNKALLESLAMWEGVKGDDHSEGRCPLCLLFNGSQGVGPGCQECPVWDGKVDKCSDDYADTGDGTQEEKQVLLVLWGEEAREKGVYRLLGR
jgi:hypothetical protein